MAGGGAGSELGRIYRLGALNQSPREAPHHRAVFAELQKLGFIEGQNLTVYGRGYGMRAEQFDEVAQEQIKTKVDVILCGGEPAALAAQRATSMIPIVAVTDDMVRSGLVRSLQNPGGNTTGVSIFATDLDGKRQEILLEAVPGLRRMAALADTGTTPADQLGLLQKAAQARGVELSILRVNQREEIGPAIVAAKASGAAALNVLASALLFNNRQIILQHVADLRLPAIYQWPEIAENDGLLGYGPRIVQIYRDIVARQLGAILRGARPADTPVEQPTRFDLVINLKVAKAIGHEVPAGLVLRADEVIE